ncbi:MAG: branched-chain amino acid ABC transporter permease [Xanthobacteraceae bacterium]|nr:branched-chain amino acid ABC transporter permease [Xanthobacteraceae bacterium]MBV9629221.1 branched-chain amino acid ABC transporter permease [Xanthobacteraceae bacterium]
MQTIAQLLVSGIMLGGIYALMSIGLTLIFGVLKIVNFAHGEFLMLAMYAAWGVVSFSGVNVYAAAIIVIPLLFGFGALIYWLIVRPAVDKPHLVVVFATMGLSILMQNLALVLMTADLRDVPPLLGGTSLQIGPLYLRIELVLGFLISVAITFGLMLFIKRSYLGKAIRATVQDPDAAMLMGINVPRLFLLTFAGGSALVGLAGCIMLPLYSTFPTVGGNFILIAYVIVVLGGMGSMEGALLGGICIGLVQSLSSYYVAPAYGQMFYFVVFLLVMIFRPDGLFGQRGAAMVGINE